MRRSLAGISGVVLASSAALAVSSPAPASAQEQASAQSEEITVTARRREESLLDVPISINVVDGDQLAQDGIDRAEDLQYLVPGLSVVSFLGGANPSIRGVGTGQNVSGTDESVGVYLDEIFQGVGSSSFSRSFDVERVEVLKGPQGTLYGRNVTAGAIQLVSRAPELGEYSGQASATYGTYESIRADAALNLPLGDSAALRIAGTFGESEGFVRNVDTGDYLNGEDYAGARVRLLVEPTDAIRIDLGVQYMRDDTPYAWEVLDFEPNFLGYGRVRSPSDLVFASDDALNANLRVDVDLSQTLTLRSITGYFEQDGETGVVGPGDIADPLLGATQVDANTYEQFSQEFQLQWSQGDNSGVLGLYYLDADGENQRRIDFFAFGLVPFQNPVNVDTNEAWAIFGETQLALSERLSLITGLRYGREERGLTISAGNPPGLIDPIAPISGSDTFSATTGRVGLTYDLDPETMLFATISRGFKSGGLQSTPLVDIGSYAPEYLWAYEIGVKRGLSNGGTVEFTLFRYDYTDLQVFQAVSLFDFQVVNAAEASIFGMDFNSRLRLGEHLGWNLALSYLDSQYEDFIFQEAGGASSNLDGFSLARAPEWSVSNQLVLDNWSVAGWDGELRLEANYRDEIFTTVDSPADMESASLDALTLLNLGLSFEQPSANGLAVFINGRNLADERYYEFSGGGGLIGGIVAPGRVYEVGLRARF